MNGNWFDSRTGEREARCEEASRKVLLSGGTAEEALQASVATRAAFREEERKKRGGARPGAGRPRGSTKDPGGRKADSALNFRVTSEFKARFDAQARAAGMNGTEYLKSLVENAAAR